MKTDSEHYFGVMMGMDAALGHLRDVLDDHKDCPGCDLCVACVSIEYTMKIFADLIAVDAPWEAMQQFREETDPDALKRFQERMDKARAVAPSAAPAPPPSAGLPPAKDRPYWLS